MKPLAIKRIAIVNRGEAAMRLIRAAREVALEQESPLTTIALYTEVERNAMFVREADRAVRIYSDTKSAYLDYDVLEAALDDSGADAVWVGWGFVSEDPEFADRVERMGLTFIGPSGEMMRRLGDKIGAKRLAEECGVPVAPWSGGAVADIDEARRQAEAIGYPLMIKAAAGGGGRGIRRVNDPTQLDTAFSSARREAASSFGDDTVFMESVISGGRHVEVQIVADGQGGIWAVGVRDCSIQRRNQKVIEESASTALGADAERPAKTAAVALAAATAYRGAGTVEFLYQAEQDRLAFLEVNTRLQVEHPVTEVTTGVDLVKLQLHVAGGGLLTGQPPQPRGHAIEVRLNAEDPERDFAPAPGVVEHLVWASGPGVRIETGLAQGDVIPAEFDSMIAKVIGFGHDRPEARARVLRALRETTVVIRGGMTNKAFLAGLLGHPDVLAGRFDTTWLDGLMRDGTYRPPEEGAVALMATAIDSYEANRQLERQRFFGSAIRGRPQTGIEVGHRVELRRHGTAYALEVFQIRPRRYRVLVDGRRLDVDTERGGPWERRLVVAGRAFRVVSISEGAETVVEVDGLPHRVSEDDGGLVRAPSPGVVVHIAVSAGDDVSAGALLATLESMKMEVTLRAPAAGRVREVMATAGAPVDGGSALFRLEADAAGAEPDSGGVRVDFSAVADPEADDPAVSLRLELGELRAQVLGYDYNPDEARRVVDGYRRHRAEVAPGDERALRGELAVLNAFSDVVGLGRNRRTGEDEAAEDVHSPREFFHAFLSTMDVTRAGLPASFEAKLRAALADYEVDELTPSAALDDALLWMFLAQQRSATLQPALMAILGYHLDHPEVPAELHNNLLDTLDRVILATQIRHPVIGTLARSVRWRLFDEPLIQAGQEQTRAEMRQRLSVLAATRDPEKRAAHMEELVSCPLPLIRLMAGLGERDEGQRRELIEVQTRRYYQAHGLADVRRLDGDGQGLVVGTFEDNGEHRVVVAAGAATTRPSDLADILAAVAHQLGTSAVGVADLYVQAGSAGPDEDLGTGIAGALAARPLPDGLRRVTVSVPTTATHVSRYTFERNGVGFVANQVLRDLHPMIATRLHLWRLAEFDLERLAAPDDVYLFEATARTNRDDRRLVALAEVRDLTPLRDATGAVVAIPALEHVLDSCLEGLRGAIAASRSAEPPQWNRIVLHVWPPIDFAQSELLAIVRSLAPRTGGVGLEQVGVQGRVRDGAGTREVRLRMQQAAGTGLTFEVTPSPRTPLRPLDSYNQLVLRAQRRGNVYPYQLIPLLLGQTPDQSPADQSPDDQTPADRSPADQTPAHQSPADQTPADRSPADQTPGDRSPAGRSPGGTDRAGSSPAAGFTEYDLSDSGEATPVERPYGENEAAIIFGTVTTPTARYPEGMTRVALFGDPTKALGSVSEPECRRIVAALDLAESLGAPVEWLALSSGAKIAMDSGTENMDWIARALRRLIEFTQDGGEVNVVVAGINVGAQPYWNAEATMLMHTKGILVMTPDSAMVLTGKQALEYSGGVAAEDNFGIGGYDRVMGPNGQAQYWAADLVDACRILMAHYEFAYVAPGERFARRALTRDPEGRDVRSSVHHHPDSDFFSIGDVFSPDKNAERKKAFDIRTLMRAVIDEDLAPLERWAGMVDADTAVVLDAFLGGYPVTVIGIESRPLPRLGLPPADGPDSWSGGTLFPLSSKKVARAINAASGNRPVVVLANLSGFDGSPESLRRLQLEYGAEIGRAVVNFDGPIVFCVVSRYHGGAFVVFSGVLNEGMEVAAVDGSYASVIGGGPAAAVVFAGEVRKRAEADKRIVELAARIARAGEGEAGRLRSELEQLRPTVRAEKQAEIAAEFDRIHSIKRAQEVGSVDSIVKPGDLRPYLIQAVERGRRRTEQTRRP